MRLAVIAMLCGLLAPAGQAVTTIPTSASFPVSATISSGCLVVGNPSQTSGVGFGKLDFGTHPATMGGTVNASLSMNAGSMAQVQCTPGVTVTMTLDGGQNASGSQRRMKLGTSSYLPYALFSAPGGTTPLMPGVGVSVNASSGPITLPVYGVATMPSAGLPAGQYSDTVQVMFSW